MQPAFRRLASGAAVAALLGASCLAAASPAAAFKVIDSPDFQGCAVWANDAGQPLHSKEGREIGRKAPCGGDTHSRDTYETLFGAAPGTLVIRDSTHKIECLMVLAPGSASVVVPKACQAWAGD